MAVNSSAISHPIVAGVTTWPRSSCLLLPRLEAESEAQPIAALQPGKRLGRRQLADSTRRHGLAFAAPPQLQPGGEVGRPVRDGIGCSFPHRRDPESPAPIARIADHGLVADRR